MQLNICHIIFSFNPFPNEPLFLCVCSTSLVNTGGKRSNCSEQVISPFPEVFSTPFEEFLPFSSNIKLSSANSYSLEETKICCLERVNNPEEDSKNKVDKGENACNKYFLLFQQYFLVSSLSKREITFFFLSKTNLLLRVICYF